MCLLVCWHYLLKNISNEEAVKSRTFISARTLQSSLVAHVSEVVNRLHLNIDLLVVSKLVLASADIKFWLRTFLNANASGFPCT